MAASFRQDMPPKGGYASIDYKRMLPKRGASGYAMFAMAGAVMGFGFVTMYFSNRQRRKWIQEDREAKIALIPLVQAEYDREVLLRLRYNREQEAEIMKDVPDWTVGESVFNSKRWQEPSLLDLYYLEPTSERNKIIQGFSTFTGS
ncbi:NADH dehydrogenase [ubiquinone] 1 alpha subcomplex subunit 13-like [Diadema setosum]|uniref:NADH dehydrogenase [ubiquinone] 1 alpha subcomplex subunit 13-like n=1 Tax=Diadema setosum TaxID=31175 RepID=UPI003B3A1D36